MTNSTFPLSVIVHTKNSAKTVEKCLKSVRFAQDVIVIDMKSDDDTKKIAKEYADQFFTTEDVGYVEPARNFGIKQAKQDWILLLDADEELT